MAFTVTPPAAIALSVGLLDPAPVLYVVGQPAPTPTPTPVPVPTPAPTPASFLIGGLDALLLESGDYVLSESGVSTQISGLSLVSPQATDGFIVARGATNYRVSVTALIDYLESHF